MIPQNFFCKECCIHKCLNVQIFKYNFIFTGKLFFVRKWRSLIFIGAPVVPTLDNLTAIGLHISDLAIHDSSRSVCYKCLLLTHIYIMNLLGKNEYNLIRYLIFSSRDNFYLLLLKQKLSFNLFYTVYYQIVYQPNFTPVIIKLNT